VRKLQTADAVTGSPDPRIRGAEHGVDLDVVAFVHHHSRVLEADAPCLRAPPDRDEHQVGLDVGGVVKRRSDGGVGVGDALQAPAGVRDDALLLDDAPELLHDTNIHAGQDLRQHLHDRHPAAEGDEQAGELAPDHPAAHDEQVLGQLLQPEYPVRRPHQRVFHVEVGEACRLGAHADDEVVVVVPPPSRDHRITVHDALLPDDAHALSLARSLDAAAHLEHHLFLARHHAREVDARFVQCDAEVICVTHLAQQVGAGQQRLGWNAPPVETRAAELGALHQGDLSAQLGGPKCCDIAGGATAEDDDLGTHDLTSLVARDALSAGAAGCSVRGSRVVLSAASTMRSCSRWWEPAYPSDGLARLGLPM